MAVRNGWLWRPGIALAFAILAGPAVASPPDVDAINWIDVGMAGLPSVPTGRPAGLIPGAEAARFLTRIADRRTGRVTTAGGGRLLERLRGGPLQPRLPASVDGGAGSPAATVGGWPLPETLVHQVQSLGRQATAAATRDAAVIAWTDATLDEIDELVHTAGPLDPRAPPPILALGDAVEAGLDLAARIADRQLAADTRSTTLALARRVTLWRAAITTAAGSPTDLERVCADTQRLLWAVERFELASGPAQAADVQRSLRALAAAGSATQPIVDAMADHYLAANVRLAVHQQFVARLLPEATASSEPMQDFILGRRVRGTRTVEQSIDVRFVPDPERIRIELLVNGEVASRTVTESGPVTFHSRGAATFVVRKPVFLSQEGLAFGQSLASASNQSQLANIRTGFDGVPIMGQVVRSIARNQHDDSRAEVAREVNQKIVTNARREVDRQVEPRFTDLAETIRGRVWNPLVGLGLEPTPTGLVTTPNTATIRLRLAATDQLAAHTPRPRPPDDALLAVQLHESAINNACERLGLAGRRLRLEDLVRLVCERIGVEPRQPDDLPEGVVITFADERPIRITCRDGLVHVAVSLTCLEGGRRSWHDVIAQVAYRPVRSGPQVWLEREGPVQLSGPGHQGRIELALRTIFGKIFAKERPIAVLPERIAGDPRLADVQAVQAVSAAGWFALALAEPPQVAAPATDSPTPQAATPARRPLLR
jgi:hypothetical protein